MSALWISLLALLLMLGGAAAGLRLRALLPEDHVNQESREIVNLCVGVTATMAALVLGLLIASAKGSFDSKVRETQQIATNVVLINQALRQYGPQAADARKLLLAVATEIHSHALDVDDDLAPGQVLSGTHQRLQALQRGVFALTPGNDEQRWLQARALTLTADLAQASEMLSAHEDSSLPMPFLFILVCWLVIIFGCLGLFAPANHTVRAVVFVCVLSTSGAIFLILEMDRPFDGWIQVSTKALKNGLAKVGQ